MRCFLWVIVSCLLLRPPLWCRLEISLTTGWLSWTFVQSLVAPSGLPVETLWLFLYIAWTADCFEPFVGRMIHPELVSLLTYTSYGCGDHFQMFWKQLCLGSKCLSQHICGVESNVTHQKRNKEHCNFTKRGRLQQTFLSECLNFQVISSQRAADFQLQSKFLACVWEKRKLDSLVTQWISPPIIQTGSKVRGKTTASHLLFTNE